MKVPGYTRCTHSFLVIAQVPRLLWRNPRPRTTFLQDDAHIRKISESEKIRGYVQTPCGAVCVYARGEYYRLNIAIIRKRIYRAALGSRSIKQNERYRNFNGGSSLAMITNKLHQTNYIGRSRAASIMQKFLRFLAAAKKRRYYGSFIERQRV